MILIRMGFLRLFCNTSLYGEIGRQARGYAVKHMQTGLSPSHLVSSFLRAKTYQSVVILFVQLEECCIIKAVSFSVCGPLTADSMVY